MPMPGVHKRMQTDIFTRYAPENAADAESYAAVGYLLGGNWKVIGGIQNTPLNSLQI